MEFAEHVRESAGVGAVFARVEVAYLDGTPSIPDAVRSLVAAGLRPVLVAPLFLSPSTHLTEDVPGVLGLGVPDHVRRRLIGEGRNPLPPGMPLRLLDPGPLDDLLYANVCRRLALRTTERGEEGVVLCAYGSTVHHARWEALLHRLQRRILEEAGFRVAVHAYVGHVVGCSTGPTEAALRHVSAVAGVRRVHVVPLLLAEGRLHGEVIQAAVDSVVARGAPGLRVLYAGDAVLPDGDLAARIAQHALGEVGVFFAPQRGVEA